MCDAGRINTDLPGIKIGFLNMMPDAALAATERQFLRLAGANPKLNCYVYAFNIGSVERSHQARQYIQQHYLDFSTVKSINIDALIITGANVSQPLLTRESIWRDLQTILIWAKDNVRSTLCSCLAVQAALKIFYNIDRRHLADKCWGVFSHQVVCRRHRLMRNVEANVYMCHSRFNDISCDDFNANNITVLLQSRQAGVQLAAEADMSMLYFQGHPEYDDISLLKEYKREIIRYLNQQREDYPPAPANYFDAGALHEIAAYKALVASADNQQALLENFPERALQKNLINAWKKPARTIFSNWLNYLVD